MNANGDNFVLRLPFVNEFLAFVAAHFIQVSKLNVDRTYMSWWPIDTANRITPDGVLVWSGRCEFILPPDLTPSRGTWEYFFPKK
jgi:hypothetical protein